MSAEDVFSFAKEMADSAICLCDGGHNLQAAMLMYVAIEQMAWLSVEPLRSGPVDFQEWVKKYMQPYAPLPCTAREMWEARNGLLHMGTAESAGNRDNAEIRFIYYFYGSTADLFSKSNSAVYVKVEDLVQSYLTGVMWFKSDLEANPNRMDTVKDKLRRMLAQRPIATPTPR